MASFPQIRVRYEVNCAMIGGRTETQCGIMNVMLEHHSNLSKSTKLYQKKKSSFNSIIVPKIFGVRKSGIPINDALRIRLSTVTSRSSPAKVGMIPARNALAFSVRKGQEVKLTNTCGK
jgi:hypothetical protein